MKSKLSTAGRIIYALPMAIFGFVPFFLNEPAMAGMIPSWLPGGTFWVYLTGLALIAAAVSILMQKKAPRTLLLAIMLVIFVLVLHLPGVLTGGYSAQLSTSMLLKDLALAGSAFSMSGSFSN